MIPSLNIWAWLGIAAIVISAIGGGYWFIYHQGAASEIVKQEKAFNKLKDKTDEVQDRALTTTNPRDELRKYGRPD